MTDLQDKLNASEATVQRLTEENRQLTEECETAQMRIATLMEVHCSVFDDLQDTNHIISPEITHLLMLNTSYHITPPHTFMEVRCSVIADH